jgi:hypothetical protein
VAFLNERAVTKVSRAEVDRRADHLCEFTSDFQDIMKRRLFIACAATPLISSGSGPLSAQTEEWNEVIDPDGRYRLQMPKGFRYVALPRPDGGTMRQYSFVVAGKFGLDFLVTSFVGTESGLPAAAPQVPARLEAMQGGMQRSWPGSTVIEQQPIQLGSVQGRSFVLAVDQDRAVVMVRLYYSSHALYSQTVHAFTDGRQDPTIAQFMNSLRLEA